MTISKKTLVWSALVALSATALQVQAAPANKVSQFVQTVLPTVQTQVLTSDVLSELKEANKLSSEVTRKQMLVLNHTWRQQIRGTDQPVVQKMANNKLSKLLQQIQSHHSSQYESIVLVGQKANVVGFSQPPMDYWFGRKAVWKKAKANGLYISRARTNHTNHKRWVEVGVPVKQGGALLGVLDVKLYLPAKPAK